MQNPRDFYPLHRSLKDRNPVGSDNEEYGDKLENTIQTFSYIWYKCNEHAIKHYYKVIILIMHHCMYPVSIHVIHHIYVNVKVHTWMYMYILKTNSLETIFSNIEVEFNYFSYAVLMNIHVFTLFYFHFLKPIWIVHWESKKRFWNLDLILKLFTFVILIFGQIYEKCDSS